MGLRYNARMDDVISDPGARIERLEAHIEALGARIENCRKFMLASRVAIALGSLLLAATLFGLIAFDPVVFLAAIAAILGGFVLLGSNRTTADEATAERAEAEAQRAALIDQIDLRVIGRSAVH